MTLPFQPLWSLKNLCSNPNNGRDTSGAKQNLTLSDATDQGRINPPYCMDLILYVIRFCLLPYEREHVPKFLLAPCLETRRVMEDELWVALEGELIIHIVDPSLRHQSQRPDQRTAQRSPSSHLRGRVNLSVKG